MVVEFRVEKHSRHPKPQEIPTANLSDFNLCQVIEPIEGPGSQMCSTKGSGAQDVTCCWWFYPCFIHVSLWPPNIEVFEKAMFSHVYLQKSWGVWCYHWAHRDRSTAQKMLRNMRTCASTTCEPVSHHWFPQNSFFFNVGIPMSFEFPVPNWKSYGIMCFP